jgi:hypothetical protein
MSVQLILFCFAFGATAPQWTRASSFTSVLDHTQQRTTFDSGAGTSTSQHTTLTTDKTPMPPVGFEHTISEGEGPLTYTYLRPRGHWDRRAVHYSFQKYNFASPNWCVRVRSCWLQTLPETVTRTEQFGWSSTWIHLPYIPINLVQASLAPASPD